MVNNSLEFPEGWGDYHCFPKMENPKGWGVLHVYEIPSVVGVWIFSGTTQYTIKIGQLCKLPEAVSQFFFTSNMKVNL